jgi:hypothetical protein
LSPSRSRKDSTAKVAAFFVCPAKSSVPSVAPLKTTETWCSPAVSPCRETSSDVVGASFSRRLRTVSVCAAVLVLTTLPKKFSASPFWSAEK